MHIQLKAKERTEMTQAKYDVKAGELLTLSYTELHENESVVCVALVDFNIKEVADNKEMPSGMHYSDYLINEGYVEKKLMNQFFLGDDDKCKVDI
jgi:hypothetical protein